MKMLSAILLLFFCQCVNAGDIEFLEIQKSKSYFDGSFGFLGYEHLSQTAFERTLSNGEKEIITTSSDLLHGVGRFIIAVRYNQESNAYYIHRTSPFIDHLIDAIKVVDINGDGVTEALIWSNGELLLINLDNMKIINRKLFGSSTNDIEFADANNDGVKDIVFQILQNTYLVNPEDWNDYTSIDLFDESIGGSSTHVGSYTDIAIGNIDADEQNEIVIAGSGIVFEITPDNNIVFDWVLPVSSNNSRIIEITDLNDDGINEIITGDHEAVTSYISGIVRIFDGVNKTLLQTIDATTTNPAGDVYNMNISSILISDVNGDDIPEIVMGGRSTNVTAYSLENNEIISIYESAIGGSSGIVIGNLDGGSKKEIFFGAGWNSSGPNNFQVHDLDSGDLKWSSDEVNGGYIFAGIDDDTESVVAVSRNRENTNHLPGYVHELDDKLENTKWQSDIDQIFDDSIFSRTGHNAALLVNVDEDSSMELILSSSRSFQSTYIHIFDMESKLVQKDIVVPELFESSSPLSRTISSVTTLDFNKDGHIDIAFGTKKLSSYDGNTEFFVYDIFNDEFIFSYAIDHEGWAGANDIDYYDYNSDGFEDIVFASYWIYFIDGKTHEVTRSVYNDYTNLEVVVDDGVQYLLAGNLTGDLVMVHDGDLNEDLIGNACVDGEYHNQLDGIKQFSVDDEHHPYLLFYCADNIGIFDLRNYRRIWKTESKQSRYGPVNDFAIKKNGNFFDIYSGGDISIVHYKDGDLDEDGIGNIQDLDDDSDGYEDLIDDYPLDSTQWDNDPDNDGIPNESDDDDDGDGVVDTEDAFPLDPDESADTDGDGVGNNADTDDDGDGVADTEDTFPLDADESVDTDGDGLGNNADTDDDGDGVVDTEDAFPLDPEESVDTDGDGLGNNADTDDDDDGVADTEDAFPLDPSRSAESSISSGSGGGSIGCVLLFLLLLTRQTAIGAYITKVNIVLK
jgi:hypothetical protein